MIDAIKIRLPDAKKTQHAGSSLAWTLYSFPVDILLTGELGAGKTTFLQGFARALGIKDLLVSPTYALEQRYNTSSDVPLLHLDLYRLKEKQAVELIASTDDHSGIRCIEWADRLPDQPTDNCIRISLKEEGNGRVLDIAFDDIRIPSEEEINAWQKEMHLPQHIIYHCRAVSDIAAQLADVLLEQGTIIRKTALKHAALVHDLFRFLDFHDSASPPGMTFMKEQLERWEEAGELYKGMNHEIACEQFLIERGFPAIAKIVATHGFKGPSIPRTTIEQKLLFYADKRVMLDQPVSLQQRFDDFAKRYGNGIVSSQAKKWREDTEALERELFPQGVPF